MFTDYPLTKQQLGLWIEQKLHPNNTSYNTCVKVKLEGELDIEKFIFASRDVIQFFDTLKVYFVEEKGRPVQRIDDSVEYVPEYIDISDGAEKETDQKGEQAKRLLSDKLNTPIDLTRFPIMRATLIRTAANTFYFIGMVPHIVSDGRAAILYLESLSVAYNSGTEGLTKFYGETKKNWQDFQKDGLFEPDAETYQLNKQHWQQRLKNANHYFDYSYGKKLVDPDDKQGERVYFDLSEEISSRLKTHCKQKRTTMFNIFVAAFSIFIHKYYQLTDILIGYPVNVRPPGYKHFFGFFVNILPIRIDMTGNPSYLELVERIHNVRKEDKRHQRYPALDIVADIRESLPDFDGRVFNLSMAQTVSRLFDLELDGIKSQPLDSDYYDVNDDFSLSYELIENRIGLWFEYRKALFDRNFIDQAMSHIQTIISQMLEHPERQISDFTLLSQQEAREIISESEAVKKKANAADTTIDRLFEKQVESTPSAIAIIDGKNSFSFEQINQHANRLANRIIMQTDGEVGAIAVSQESGADLIISLLAILKSGCYYIPIPNAYPKKRKAYIIKQTRAKVWLVDSDDANEELIQTEWLTIDVINVNEKKELKEHSSKNLAKTISSSSTAYVIYTSGSTGVPKGVELSHKSVCSRLLWLKEYFNLSDKNGMLQNTDYSFDVSVAEIFWPLISGTKLVIADKSQTLDPHYLLNLVEKYKVTHSCMVPSLLRLLIGNDRAQQLKSLTHVLSAGEPLSESLRNDFYQNSSTKKAQLYNFYGPTEAAIYASFEKVSRDQEQPIGIGKALGETILLVLDKDMNLVPKGVVGQLYIGGQGIAKGYLGSPELTQNSFGSNPFSQETKERLYATGDMVRLGFNGKLEYIGRTDHQVKIRGFRVELGEVESSISQCEQVKDVVVINYLRGNDKVIEGSKEQQLVAYVVLNETFDSSQNDRQLSEIKQAIKEKLPLYMLPSLFSVLSVIPRLQSGKIDRKALPNPFEKLKENTHYVPPSTEVEQTLVEIWGQILSISQSEISVTTSFFDLGGDSLMAIQFVNLAEQKGLYFDMGDLFELRNIKELSSVAKTVEEVVQIEVTDEAVCGQYPLLPRQAKFFHDQFVKPNHWNRTFSFNLNHNLDVKFFKQAIKAVLVHHDNLRVDFFESESGEWLQNCHSAEWVDGVFETLFVSLDLSDLPYEIISKKMEESINELHQQIEIKSAPLIRIGHYITGESKGHLAIVFHHLLVDMVSSRLIFEDLMTAYQMALKGVNVVFPKKTTSVKQWSESLSGLSLEIDPKKEVTYWTEFPAAPIPELPLKEGVTKSTAIKINTEGNSRLKMFVLDRVNTQRILKDLFKQKGISIQDFLLACFFDVISSWSKSHALTVNTCGHGREIESKQFNLSRTVGWLNTVYPVYLKFDGCDEISLLDSEQFLQNIRQQLAQVPKNNIYYNLLRYTAQHPEITKHSEPNLFFNYVGQIDAFVQKDAPFVPTLDLPGIAGIAPENHLCYQLYFEAGVIGGQLTFRLTYSEALFDSLSMDRLAKKFIESINKHLDNVLGVPL